MDEKKEASEPLTPEAIAAEEVAKASLLAALRAREPKRATPILPLGAVIRCP